MNSFIRIGIIGDYDGRVSHQATDQALQHAAAALGIPLVTAWLPTIDLLSDPDKVMEGFDGLWCSPGSPYQSMHGALNGIRYAREHRIPFIGTCGGFQHAVLEYAKNVLNHEEVQRENFDPYQPNEIITPLSCSLVGQTRDIYLTDASYMTGIYHRIKITEKFNCTFGLSEEFEAQLSQNGFEIQGKDDVGNPRILVLKDYPFYVITLFQPQLSSAHEAPHPLIMEYLNVVLQRGQL